MTGNNLIERMRAECDHWPRTSTLDPLLREAAAALESAREDACVALVADIRFACGDNGKRMQPELVEFIRELARDAERYRWLRDSGAEVIHGMTEEALGVILRWPDHDKGGHTLSAAIDAARGAA